MAVEVCPVGAGLASGFVPVDDLALRTLGTTGCRAATAGDVVVTASWLNPDGIAMSRDARPVGGIAAFVVPRDNPVRLAARHDGGVVTVELAAGRSGTSVGLVLVGEPPAATAGSVMPKRNPGQVAGWSLVIVALLAIVPLALVRDGRRSSGRRGMS